MTRFKKHCLFELWFILAPELWLLGTPSLHTHTHTHVVHQERKDNKVISLTQQRVITEVVLYIVKG